ncbi:hypothetical protein GCM10028796_23500 [Ramlibacter monticola]
MRRGEGLREATIYFVRKASRPWLRARRGNRGVVRRVVYVSECCKIGAKCKASLKIERGDI